jgi:DNA-directed RNA polymerase beta' subunit
MNAHLPQSYESMVELEDIAAVPHHIITPRHAKPMIGIYQDTLVGSYLLTQTGIKFNRREFMNLMMWNKRFDGTMPAARWKDGPDRWTGQQVLGALLPPINMELGNKMYDNEQGTESTNYVKITQGDIEQGVVDGDIYMKPSKGIVHVTYNDHGPKETVDLLDSLQNTVENFLVLNGFSVGISDLIADEETKRKIDTMIQERKKQVEQVILQVHLDLFDNNTGKTNQQEFEDQIFGILNQATSDAGSAGQQSLSSENRLLAMVRSGSKGEPLNVAQMMACLGQTAIEGKRVPYGFTDRTLPHYKKYDDSSEARGFIESSFIRGLTPQQFFFHAMSGREGLIDTAVKSVTADTEIIIIENGKTKWTKIGPWIDAHLSAASDAEVEHYEEANMELLNLTNEVYIPTTDMDGKMSWGKMTAITRHDPGDILYKITTKGGKNVIVTAGKSLLIWDDHLQRLKEVYTKDVNVGDCVPVTMNLPSAPMTVTHIDMSEFFPKKEYVHGTDFHIAKDMMMMAQGDKFHIPRGWWEKSNGTTFTLPYPSKARFQRVLSGRSKVEHIQSGSIYAYHAERTDVQIPERFMLNEENGIFIGLFLADGNADVPSGYVQITKNDESVRTFVKNWFTKMGMKFKESSRDMTLSTVNDTVSNGTSTEVRGFSRLVAQFLTAFVGHGSEHKHVPDIAFTAPLEFVKGILNGYISGDGHVSKNSIDITSVSHRMLDGIAMLLSRLGIFAYQSKTHTCTNNIGTKHILPIYRLHIRSLWANHLKNVCSLIHTEKQEKLMEITTSASHIHYEHYNDIVLDTITAITEVSTELHPKMYDVTIPSTLNFAIANGINCRDTADTGYIQRQLIKSMEDLTVQHDGTVRDPNNNIIQFHYGEDGINPTKIETQSLPIGKLSREEIETEFKMTQVDWSTVLVDGLVRDSDEELLTEFANELLFDQRMMVEGVFQKKSLDSGSVFAPVNLARWVLNTKVRCGLNPESKTDLTPAIVLNGIKKIIERTHPYHKIWCALLRFHLAPHKIIVKERFTKEAFEMLMEIILVSHMKAWVQPGDQVGIVAAQSIGEPATQMTSLGSTVIQISDGANLRYYGTIRDFCDAILEENKEKLHTIALNSVVLPLEKDYYIVGVSDDEKTSWKRISEISRHPANGGMVEMVTRTGRRTTATLSHSFLTRSTSGVIPILGSDLKVGMRTPIARIIPETPNAVMNIIQGSTTFALNREFGWVCGMYLADGCFNGNITRITKINPIVEEKLTIFANQYKIKFSTIHKDGEFGPGKDNNLHSKDLKDFLMATFKTGSYEKEIGATVFHANKEFIAGVIGGYFDGDGNVSVERQLIRASSRSKKLIEQVTALLGYVGLFGSMSSESSVRIKDKVQHTLCILPKFAKLYKEQVGFHMPEKAQALDEIIAYNVREDAHAKPEAIDKIPELGSTIAETGRLLKMPGQSRTYGRWAKKEAIGRQTLEKYVEEFEAKIKELDEKVEKYDEKVQTNMKILQSALNADVVWDEIVELIYHKDPMELVYDFTVPGNDSFMVDCNVLIHNTLNTFHQAGVASKSAVTRGVPRLRELLKVTQNPKASSLTIYMKPEYRDNKEKARELVQDLELTVLRNITDRVAIYWDQNEDDTVVEDDKALMRFYRMFEEQQQQEQWSKWMLRLELNREEMFNRNISIQDVVFVIKQQYASKISVVYSDYNSDNLIMRIRLPSDKDQDTPSQMDDFTNLKKFQNKLLNNIVIRGLSGIKAVTFRNDKQYVEMVEGKYEKVEQFVLDTDGSNFINVMNHPLVDGTKLYSTNVWDVYEVLGIEATRAILFNEINGLFDSVGVNYRHLCLLCDVMTRFGRLMSIDRYGINKNDIGPLAKASFEETEKILLKAALFGEVDPVTGVSANIMMGQPIRGGTAFSQIVLDDQMLVELLSAVDVDKNKGVLEKEKEGNLAVELGVSDPCSITKFQMNMVLPSAKTVLEEPDIEIDII